MKIHFKVWFEKNETQVLFGEGRLQLLQAISDQGSLARAAKKMEMSYRAAWGRLKASEDRLGFPLTEKEPALGKRGGLRLTAQGRELLEKYRTVHQALERLVVQLEKKLF
jgi:molybdate transport system regulatory protein